MDNEIKTLKRALDQATPTPSATKRARDLELALKTFNAAQGSTDPARLPQDPAPNARGFLRGFRNMITRLNTPMALAATSSIAVASLAAFVVLPNLDLSNAPPAPIPASETRNRAAVDNAADRSIVSAPPEPVVEAPVVIEEQAATFDALSNLKRAPLAFERAPASMRTGDEISRLQGPVASSERFANDVAHGVTVTAENSVSTFSIDVDTASYSVIRSSLTQGSLPPAEAVRIEEMINYFPYDYAGPERDGAAFAPSVSVFETPWNSGTQLMRIGLQGELPMRDRRPPLNLVFLIDTSGSMNSPDKLPLLIQSFGLMLTSLAPEDEVAIVTYAGAAGEVLAPTPANDRAAILGALQGLSAGGSTAGQAGLQQAYSIAETMTEEGEVSRVILATDGDFNIGISDPEALKSYIAQKRDAGTYLSVLGFGRGNLKDSVMQALAQNGNGNAAYIDTLSEAQKVLNDELSGALFPIANDVKVQVEFNPAQVSEYRLIGYETRRLARTDFNNDAVDAGEIGAGHQVTALYEITPVGSAAALSEPLRYGGGQITGDPASDEIAFVKLRYKAPGSQSSRLLELPVTKDTVTPDTDARFAAAIAGFGQLLRGGDHLGQWGYQEAIDLAARSRGSDAFGYRAEAVTLMRLAQTLSEK
ncbi:VWA domain-containing protein [Roseobacter sp. YSTF-M11]|uniref:VWA domain-containing protein n=1 Tax=Roseobacter insulae TaxID=2859783 RepID=A0A9X1FZ22_9RHOB|nr:VWA domain-containing protein [Roseobacter insulae]MBW4709997.1 VWA domain-containing protein [Roseobacter insulae]